MSSLAWELAATTRSGIRYSAIAKRHEALSLPTDGTEAAQDFVEALSMPNVGMTKAEIVHRYGVERYKLEKLLYYMTQTQLAKAIGISAAYLSDVLNSNRAPGPTIQRFLLGFGERRRGYR